MQENIQLRAQTILYKNTLDSVEKSVASIANAVAVSKKKGGYIKRAEIYFGDASPEAIMSEEYIKVLNAKYGNDVDIYYTFFGFNSGTSKGQNILFKNCNTEYLMIYNPDIVVCSTFFINMIDPYLSGDGNVGMVEARQTPIEHPKSYDMLNMEEIWGAMACVVVPSDVYRELGGLDEENFFMYCDDVDFSWRVRLSGRKVLYSPNTPVFHGHRLNSKGALVASEAEKYYSAESALMMAYKWSNDKRLKQLIEICASGDSYQRKALAYYNKRKEEGTLPQRLDSNHKIAYFKNGCYSKNRY